MVGQILLSLRNMIISIGNMFFDLVEACNGWYFIISAIIVVLSYKFIIKPLSGGSDIVRKEKKKDG
mgnify:CR=1 FL=1